MSDRRKQDKGLMPVERITTHSAMGTETLVSGGYNRRSGQDRRKHDLLAEARELLGCPPHHQEKTWETIEKMVLRILITMMGRRK